MKTRLSLIIMVTALAAVMASGSVLAQKSTGKRDVFGGPPSAEEKLVRLSESLDLNDEQTVALLVVLQETETRRNALHEQATQLMKPEICALMIETESEILDILTPEQADQFLALKAERRDRAEERARHRGRMGPPDCSQYEDSDG